LTITKDASILDYDLALAIWQRVAIVRRESFRLQKAISAFGSSGFPASSRILRLCGFSLSRDAVSGRPPVRNGSTGRAGAVAAEK
jgi:hypothetical protein